MAFVPPKWFIRVHNYSSMFNVHFLEIQWNAPYKFIFPQKPECKLELDPNHVPCEMF